MRYVLLFIVMALIFSMPAVVVAGPDEVNGNVQVTMEIEGMT